MLLYFELCEQIWDGSPATNAISSGIETTEIDGDNDKPIADSEQPSSLQNSILSVDSSVSINDRPDSPEGIDSSLEDNTPTLPASVVKERR